MDYSPKGESQKNTPDQITPRTKTTQRKEKGERKENPYLPQNIFDCRDLVVNNLKSTFLKEKKTRKQITIS